ncbi:MAG: phosphohydrolase [Anaerolineae bacterium]|nr:phosphohydrolase [Anaerolineae bacterium]
MNLAKGCPGSLHLREPRPEYVECPNCQAEVEIWTDEPLARCESCGFWLTHEVGASCIDWCAKAAECVGLDLYERLKQRRPPETGQNQAD